MTSAARNTPNTMTVNGRSHRHSDHCGAGAAGALGKRGLDGMDRRASEKCLISGTRARSRLDERRVTMIDLTRRDVVMAAGGIAALAPPRSEERRVGKEGVRTCRSRWTPVHYNKNK